LNESILQATYRYTKLSEPAFDLSHQATTLRHVPWTDHRHRHFALLITYWHAYLNID
jgi:hypothetical protein